VRAHSLPPRRRTRATLWRPVRRRACAAAPRAWMDWVASWMHRVGDSGRTRGGPAAPRACTLKPAGSCPRPAPRAMDRATQPGQDGGPSRTVGPSLCDLADAASCLAGLPVPARAPERNRSRAFDCAHLPEGGARLPSVGVQAAEQLVWWCGGWRGGVVAGAVVGRPARRTHRQRHRAQSRRHT